MKKKIFLLLPALFLALSLGACNGKKDDSKKSGDEQQQPSGGGEQSGGEGQGGEGSGGEQSGGEGQGGEGSGGEGSGGEGQGGGEQQQSNLLYFRDAAWWNASAAATYYSFDEAAPAAMTHIEYVAAAGFNYWSVELPESATTVVFERWGVNGETQVAEFWGAKTVSVTLADRGTHNMYDISATEAAWAGDSNFVTGVWADYAGSEGQGGEGSGGEGQGGGEQQQGSLLYFRDAGWWNAYAAATYVSFDGAEHIKMTHIQYVEAEHYNYWSVAIPENAVAVVFERCGETGDDWGAKTVSVTLADRGTHNMYDISSTTEAWVGDGNYITGVWADYAA